MQFVGDEGVDAFRCAADTARYDVTMASEIFGDAMNDEINSEIGGAHKVAGRVSAVNGGDDAAQFGDGGDGSEILVAEEDTARGFEVDEGGFWSDGVFDRGGAASIHKGARDAEPVEVVEEERACGAVDTIDEDHVIASFDATEDGTADCGHAGGEESAGFGVFDGGDFLGGEVDGGIGDAGVDAAAGVVAIVIAHEVFESIEDEG